MVELKKYRVVIEFRRDPSFSTEVESHNCPSAKEKALEFARSCGYDGAVRKIDATEQAPA